MNNLITTLITAFLLSASSSIFAMNDQDDMAYLFGTQEAVEIQLISNSEMAATEGQLFGITMDKINIYLTTAAELFKPMVGIYFERVLKESKSIAELKSNTLLFLKEGIGFYLANVAYNSN